MDDAIEAEDIDRVKMACEFYKLQVKDPRPLNSFRRMAIHNRAILEAAAERICLYCKSMVEIKRCPNGSSDSCKMYQTILEPITKERS